MAYAITNFSSLKSLQKGIRKGIKVQVKSGEETIPDGIFIVEGSKTKYGPSFTAKCGVNNGIIEWAVPVSEQKEA